MRYDDFKFNELHEAMYGKNFLKNFANSQEAQGIRFGFEAEMIIPGYGGGDGSSDWIDIPDERVDDIDDAVNFFDRGEDSNSPRALRNLRGNMEEEYREWIDEQWSNVKEKVVKEYLEGSWDKDREVEGYLRHVLDLSPEQVRAAMAIGKEDDPDLDSEAFEHYREAVDSANDDFEARLDAALRTEDTSDYYRAYDDWMDDRSENEWLRSLGIRRMSDVYGRYDNIVSWPAYIDDSRDDSGEFDEDSAREIARDLASDLGIESVKVGGGYHRVTRTEHSWIIEPDGSLESQGDGMPVEIISPPMPLQEGLVKFKEFFEWAKSLNAFTGSDYRTGLHIGVSLPDVGGKVDYIKLALLLGDEYISEQFDRLGEYYAKNVIEKIRDVIEGTQISYSNKIDDALDYLRNGLTNLAVDSLNISRDYGKYVSIHPRGNYIEFRSPGGDYMDKIDTVLETVQRFAYAMYVANNKDLYKREYIKKLTQLLAPAKVRYYDSSLPQNKAKPTEFLSISDVRELQKERKSENIRTIVDPQQSGAISLYAKFLVGDLTKDQLRIELLRSASIRVNKDQTFGVWKVTPKSNPAISIEILAANENIAIIKARTHFSDDLKNLPTDQYVARLVRFVSKDSIDPDVVKSAMGQDDPDSTQTTTSATPTASTASEFTGQWSIFIDGQEVHRFGGIGNMQGDANLYARRWLNANPNVGQTGDIVEVLPIMR